MRLFLVHKLSTVSRDPDKIKAIYIQYARQSSVSSSKKEVDEYCRHLWQREKKQGLMYSKYSGPKVRKSIKKMLAPYPRKTSVKTLRVLMTDLKYAKYYSEVMRAKPILVPIVELLMILHSSYFPVSHTKNTEGSSLRSLKIKKLTKR